MLDDQKTHSGVPREDEPVNEEHNNAQSDEPRGNSPHNPTRYGDWEVGGRCNDF